MVRETEADTTASTGPPPAPWQIVAGEVGLGAVLAAGAGYGVGLLAESFCDDCDASEPGGDTAGLLIGVPAGAVVGVWLVGRMAPPSGRLGDTVLGALAGTAVFAGYAEILKEQGNALRWAGVLFPGALAAMGWNRSRSQIRVGLAADGPAGSGAGLRAEVTLFWFEF
jgi:hypothetical protein